MNMLTFAMMLAGMWILQLLLVQRQASAFQRDIARLRRSGRVITGLHRRRGLRTYVALAVDDNKVTAACSLKGSSVFARAKPLEALVGHSIADVAAEVVPGLDHRTSAAAAHAATFRDQLLTRETRPATPN